MIEQNKGHHPARVQKKQKMLHTIHQGTQLADSCGAGMLCVLQYRVELDIEREALKSLKHPLDTCLIVEVGLSHCLMSEMREGGCGLGGSFLCVNSVSPMPLFHAFFVFCFFRHFYRLTRTRDAARFSDGQHSNTL